MSFLQEVATQPAGAESETASARIEDPDAMAVDTSNVEPPAYDAVADEAFKVGTGASEAEVPAQSSSTAAGASPTGPSSSEEEELKALRTLQEEEDARAAQELADADAADAAKAFEEDDEEDGEEDERDS